MRRLRVSKQAAGDFELAALDGLHHVIRRKKMKSVATTIGVLGLVGGSVLHAPLAVAADSGWLGGLSIGQSRAEIDEERIAAQLSAAGLAPTSMQEDEKDTAFKVFGGYKFNRYFALEGGYFDLGRFGFTAATETAGTYSGDIKLRGWNVDAVGILPITEAFSALGRVGANYAQATDSFSGSGAIATPADPSPSKRDTNYKLGLGVQYDITDSLGLRGEWERYRINDAIGNDGDIDMYSIGLVAMFGGSKPAPKAATPSPRVVAVAPAPAKEEYCSVLALTYEIDGEEIQRDDKEKLAVVATFLKKYPNTTAVIEGHSDSAGPAESNMRLSLRRAQSVVNYLAADHDIEKSRLTAVGHGEKRPIANNSTEEGKRENRRINAVITCATDFEGLAVATTRTAVAMEMEFDPYKHDVTPAYHDELRKVANFMKANPSVTATVEGHADKVTGIGAQQAQQTSNVSMDVSQQRAQSVVNYLVDHQGIARSRLSSAAFGHTRRTAYGTTLVGQQENRRVIIIFNYAK